jgi:hypothetical protein
MIMQFYSTTHFYPDGKIVWMTEGVRYQYSITEWAALLDAPKDEEHNIDIYTKPKQDHKSMRNMYNPIPESDLETHKLG